MAPIKVGILGLAADKGWAYSAHLKPILKLSDKYTITALCNSSVENAQKAIKAHDLPDSVKAYGNPEDLANDPNVDLVVCSVRVDRHHKTILPALKAGKDVFSEWPLAGNIENAQELYDLAKEKGVKTVIGLQGLYNPLLAAIRKTIKDGKIGKVLSTDIYGAGWNGGATEPASVSYLTDRKVGGNMLTIHFMHTFNTYLSVFDTTIRSFNSIIETQRPTVDIVDADKNVVDTVTRNTPDQILLHGHLDSGIIFNYHLRGGPAFSPSENLRWTIYGDAGEILITAPSVFFNMSGAAGSVKVQLSKLDGSEPTDIEVETDEWEELPAAARNVGRLYEAYASGVKGSWPDWEYALEKHRLVEELWKRHDEGRQDVKAAFNA